MAASSLDILQTMSISTIERMAEKGCDFYGKNGKLFISINNTFNNISDGRPYIDSDSVMVRNIY